MCSGGQSRRSRTSCPLCEVGFSCFRPPTVWQVVHMLCLEWFDENIFENCSFLLFFGHGICSPGIVPKFGCWKLSPPAPNHMQPVHHPHHTAKNALPEEKRALGLHSLDIAVSRTTLIPCCFSSSIFLSGFRFDSFFSFFHLVVLAPNAPSSSRLFLFFFFSNQRSTVCSTRRKGMRKGRDVRTGLWRLADYCHPFRDQQGQGVSTIFGNKIHSLIHLFRILQRFHTCWPLQFVFQHCVLSSPSLSFSSFFLFLSLHASSMFLCCIFVSFRMSHSHSFPVLLHIFSRWFCFGLDSSLNRPPK